LGPRYGANVLPERASVVIVGGGVMGVSAAFHLAEAGVPDVLLLERSQLGAGSTAKAAGGVRAQFSDELNIALGARSLELFERFRDRPGGAIDLHRVGYLFLLTRRRDVAAYEAAVALQNELGVPSRMLDPGEASMLAPIIRRKGILAAAFHAGDGHCSPEGVVAGYAAGARQYGATLLTGVEVTGIGTSASSASSTGPATITEVVTSAGTVRTETVICCAGAWSARIGDLVGVHLPVTPLRRQILVTEPLPEFVAGLAPPTMPMTIDVASTFYLHREGPGLLVGMSYAGERPGFSTEVSQEWLPELTAAIEKRAPRLLTVGVAHSWAGLYENTPDHNGLIGEAAGVSRFLYATGFSGHGFLQGPAVGEVLRDLYLGQEPFVDVSPLSATRFADGARRPELHIV
jgi:sarcosine oxidase, subunit beta